MLFSAGVDSTAAGLKLQEEHYQIFPLVIDYGQKAYQAEEFAARKIADKVQFEPIKTFNITGIESLINVMAAGATRNIDAWVPMRNTLLLILGGIYTYSIDADGVCIGYMLHDHGIFGDNDFYHHKLAELLMSKSLSRSIEVFTPIKGLTKRDLVSYLYQYNLFEDTVSCWNATIENDRIKQCGKCANCLERIGAIK